MKRKVLYLVTSFPEDRNNLYSGIFNYRFIQGASKYVDFDIIHLRSWRPGRPILRKWKLGNSSVYQFNFPYTEAFGSTATSLLLLLYRKICYSLLWRKVTGVELIHSVSISLAGVVAGEFSSNLKLPHIAQCNGTDVNVDLKVMNRTLAFSNLSKRIQTFACNSQALAKEVQKIYPKSNVKVIYRGVDLDKFKKSSLKQNEVVTFLFLGGLSLRKGHSEGRNFKGGINVLQANAHLSNLVDLPPYSIYFGGPEVTQELVSSILEKNNLKGVNKIQIIGKLSPSEVPQYIEKSTIVLVVSMMEGLPNMGMEAMARGRALIGSTVGGIPELIDDGLTGYLVPKNKPISLADKMEWCIRNSDKLENMGNRAHEKVVEYFNYDKGLKDYLQLYENHIKE